MSSAIAIKMIEVQAFGGFEKPLSYLVPNHMISKIQIGCLVRIPLGKRKVIGIVSSLSPKEKPNENKLKNILSLVQEKPVLNAELIKLARWMSTYYASSIDNVLESMIPSAVRDGMEEKTKRFIKINKQAPYEQTCEKLKNSPQQKKLFIYLKN